MEAFQRLQDMPAQTCPADNSQVFSGSSHGGKGLGSKAQNVSLGRGNCKHGTSCKFIHCDKGPTRDKQVKKRRL